MADKRTDGRLLPGKRSSGWLKMKDKRHQKVIVMGWHKGSGQRSGTLGSLLLAVNDGGRLRYVGGVKFTVTTKDGRLRHPTWRGRGPDMPAADVHWEDWAALERQSPINRKS